MNEEEVLLEEFVVNDEQHIASNSLGVFEQIFAARNLQSLADEVHKIISQRVGFGYFMYVGRLNQTVSGAPYQLVLSNFPKTWEILYEANNYIDVDPTIEYCFKNDSHLPLLWNTEMYDTPERQHLWKEMQHLGFFNGVSIPIRSVRGSTGALNLLNLKSYRAGTKVATAIAQASLLSTYLHEAISRLVFDHLIAAPDKSRFTPRELECLNWAAIGKSAWEIAIVMNLSSRTVRFHLESVIKKLDAQNRPQAVAKALQLGLISGH